MKVQRIGRLLQLLSTMTFCQSVATATTIIQLGSASSFAVLAGSGVTNTGTTVINGDIGSFPTTSIGLAGVTLNGVNYAGNAVTQTAKNDSILAYNDAFGRIATTIYPAVQELGGLTLTSGVFNNPTSFGVTGQLTLDGGGDSNSVWIFQAGSTVTTAASSQIVLTNGALASNVFWQVGTSATLGASSIFEGTILAKESISFGSGAQLTGGAFAETGAITMIGNTINAVPEPSGAILLCSGLAMSVIRRKR